MVVRRAARAPKDPDSGSCVGSVDISVAGGGRREASAGGDWLAARFGPRRRLAKCLTKKPDGEV